VTAGDVDETPSQSPKLQAQIKPHYRQRKVRKTGLSTVELQKAMPELSDLVSAEKLSLATYVQSCCLHSAKSNDDDDDDDDGGDDDDDVDLYSTVVP